MYIHSSCEQVLKPVKTVEGIVEKNQSLPILGNIRVEQDGVNVKFSATDLDIQIQTEAPVGVEDKKSLFTVSAAKFSSILNSLSASDSISVDLDGSKLAVSSSSGSFSLQTLPAEQYPVIKESEWEQELEVEAKVLRYLFAMTAFAQASQDVRYYLNGVLLVSEGKTLRTVATDTHRLACCEITLEKDTPAVQVIIPRKTVRELIRLLPEDDTPVKVQFSDTQVCFTYGSVRFLSKLIEGKFPDYKRVLPTEENNPKAITLEREKLIASLRRVGIMTNEKFHGVRWILGKNELQMQSTNSEHEEAIERLPIEWNYDEMDMGFNITYLLDVLSILKSKEVCFHFAEANNSVLVTMPDNKERFRYVVMPMRI